MTRPTLLPRHYARLTYDGSGCWLWQGATHRGYGRVCHERRSWVAHRFFYTALVGPIPEGLTLDHLCRVRNCVNPAHLEPVTAIENYRRGQQGPAPRTHCPQGHAYEGDNIAWVNQGGRKTRACRECRRVQSLAYVHRRKAAGAA